MRPREKPMQDKSYSEIFRAEELGSDVVVLENNDFRVLTFDSIYEQSVLSLQEPYRLVHEHTVIMMMVMAFFRPRHVIMLGLGGGSLLRPLHRYFPELIIEAVELRASVIEAAQCFFQIPDDERVSITQQNAQDFMEAALPDSTDLIFADLYHAYEMDKYQSNVLFLRDCYTALRESGWLVVNFHDFPDSDEPVIKVMMALFPDCFVCESRSANYILFCCKTRLSGSIKSLRPQVEALERILQQPLLTHFRRLLKIRSEYL